MTNEVTDIDLTLNSDPAVQVPWEQCAKRSWYIARGPENYVWAMCPADFPDDSYDRFTTTLENHLGDDDPPFDSFSVSITEPVRDLTLWAVYYPQSAEENV